ncbi:MAG: hypothetical protein KC503_08500 [Myxococcales bacterium]|nr:hypothetical protein [Myxococcales bacterium]
MAERCKKLLFCLMLALPGLLAAACSDDSTPPAVDPNDLYDPAACQRCHRRQYDEWRGSMHAYAAISPTFDAFEDTVSKLTNGSVSPSGASANFCVNCHTPLTLQRGEAFPEFQSEADGKRLFSQLSAPSKRGIGCTYCHRVTSADHAKSLLGDGIANASLVWRDGEVFVGPLGKTVGSSRHMLEKNDFISKPELCGGCHDVRPVRPDARTNEGFQRLENLFTEWQTGPYNDLNHAERPKLVAFYKQKYGTDLTGKTVRCQDCHMSLYPWKAPTVFPIGFAATDGELVDLQPRKISPHFFSAISIALIDNFPNQFATAASPPTLSYKLDSGERVSIPTDQQSRRNAILGAAVQLSLGQTGASVTANATTLPIVLDATNVGAGHNVPSGFSQERQMWLEVFVVSGDAAFSDCQGGSPKASCIYRSGYLVDRAHPQTGEDRPDGRLHDEDLNNFKVNVDPTTFKSQDEVGDDLNQREGVDPINPTHGPNLGLVNFQNLFLQKKDDKGGYHEVHSAHLADTVDNSHSLPPFKTKTIRYDVPLAGKNVSGTVRVRVRLRGRQFPPLFLRTLAQRNPHLVTEAMVDRNLIIEMASVEKTIDVGASTP